MPLGEAQHYSNKPVKLHDHIKVGTIKNMTQFDIRRTSVIILENSMCQVSCLLNSADFLKYNLRLPNWMFSVKVLCDFQIYCTL